MRLTVSFPVLKPVIIACIKWNHCPWKSEIGNVLAVRLNMTEILTQLATFEMRDCGFCECVISTGATQEPSDEEVKISSKCKTQRTAEISEVSSDIASSSRQAAGRVAAASGQRVRPAKGTAFSGIAE